MGTSQLTQSAIVIAFREESDQDATADSLKIEGIARVLQTCWVSERVEVNRLSANGDGELPSVKSPGFRAYQKARISRSVFLV